MKNAKLLVSTTPTLQGWEIKQYLGVVSGHVVAGTGFFSDFFAGLSDIFGGRSRTYQRQLNAINEEVVDVLTQQAFRMGANCVVGMRIDHDEISGKGKSMFMVSAHGTAVIAEPSSKQSPDLLDAPILEGAVVATRARRLKIMQEAKQGTLLLDSDYTWRFLCTNRVHEVAPFIAARIKRTPANFQTADEDRQFLERAKGYFSLMPPETVKADLYDLVTIGSQSQFAMDIIQELDLCDFVQINDLLSSDNLETRKLALRLITAEKISYESGDLNYIDQIVEMISGAFPERPSVIEKGMFSGSKEKWLCLCGVKNNLEDARCISCARDRKGFVYGDISPESAVELLLRRRSVLMEHFQGAQTDSKPKE